MLTPLSPLSLSVVQVMSHVGPLQVSGGDGEGVRTTPCMGPGAEGKGQLGSWVSYRFRSWRTC